MNDSAKDNLKQRSNPISTGGGGANFENSVQSLFVVLLLTGGVAPCLPAWPIVEIKLQVKYEGIETDDFIAIAQEPRGLRKARLLVQVKRTISIGSSDETFGDVIKAAWTDYCSDAFDDLLDAFALVTGPLSFSDCSGVRTILHTARTSASSSEFLNKIELSSKLQRDKLLVFRTQLKIANSGTELSNEELWQFLKAFHLIGYDLEMPHGSAISLVQSLLLPYGNYDVEGLWAKIREEVSWNNQAAGTINLKTIPPSIRDLFETRTSEAIIPDDFAPLRSDESPIEINDDKTAEALKFAVMLGGWNDDVAGDRDVLEELMTTK